MMKKIYSLIFIFMISFTLYSCSEKNETYKPISGLDLTQNVSLKIAKYNAVDPALDYICNEFTKRYNNVTIDQIYYENYDTDALKSLRLNNVDIAFSTNVNYLTFTSTDDKGNTITTDTNDYYIDFLSDNEIDLSTTTDNLMSNYIVNMGDESSYLYSLPIGGELRGIYVNVSLLNQLGVSIPTNWSEFLGCCETISKHGYIPIQGNPSSAPNNAFLADAANSFVHDESKLAMFRSCDDGAAELLRDTFEKVYTLSINRYYDYKYVEEKLNQYKGSSAIACASSFLGLSRNSETFEYENPKNNIGYTAFFPYLNSLATTIDYLIDEYKLDTKYEFIMAPTGEENGYSYMTPYKGIVGNKRSENVNWVREFVNFIINHDNNVEYAKREGVVPNVTECMNYIAEKYNLDEKKDCAACGDILFSNYNAYTVISNALIDTAKCNAIKYMIKLEKDDFGNIVYYLDDNNNEYLLTNNGSSSKKILKKYVGEEDIITNPGYAFIKVDYFIDNLQASIAKYKE